MYPCLQDEDHILVEFFNSERQQTELEIGDIVLHRDHQEWMAHRVIASHPLVLAADWGLGVWTDVECQGRVLGFERNGQRVYWGPEGPPFKKVWALLAPMTKSSFRGVRWLARLIYLTLNELSVLSRLFRKKLRE